MNYVIIQTASIVKYMQLFGNKEKREANCLVFKTIILPLI